MVPTGHNAFIRRRYVNQPENLPDTSSNECFKIYYNLDARYAIRTDDGHVVFIQAQGIFRPGPGTVFEYGKPGLQYTQDLVEYFTTIKFEAAGDGPYNWMNGIVAIGALQSVDGCAVIDCWRLTNFPGVNVEDAYVGR